MLVKFKIIFSWELKCLISIAKINMRDYLGGHVVDLLKQWWKTFFWRSLKTFLDILIERSKKFSLSKKVDPFLMFRIIQVDQHCFKTIKLGISENFAGIISNKFIFTHKAKHEKLKISSTAIRSDWRNNRKRNSGKMLHIAAIIKLEIVIVFVLIKLSLLIRSVMLNHEVSKLLQLNGWVDSFIDCSNDAWCEIWNYPCHVEGCEREIIVINQSIQFTIDL